ncbi:MAG: hypothetical protein WCJ51_05215 [Candidatus Moraniibacteriota bacterium]
MKQRFKIFFKYACKIGLYFFALIGIILMAGFFAVRWHWTDVRGAVDANSDKFEKVSRIEIQPAVSSENLAEDLNLQSSQLAAEKVKKSQHYCAIEVIGEYAPATAAKIVQVYQQTASEVLADKMILAASLRVEEKNGQDAFLGCKKDNLQVDDEVIAEKYAKADGQTIFPWMQNEEWATIKTAIVKDKDLIDKAAAIAQIEPRLVVAATIVEQVRLFNSQRELFKKFFEPLKILGNSNKISFGVMGIKENTAIQTEEHLKDPASPYYLGSQFEGALDFDSQEDVAGQRFARLTDEKNHYYSYLYGALYLKEMMVQWGKAGFDIKYRPEIVGTLFNVGFPQSHPNANPKVGGSNIEVDGTKYTFGSLAYEFYYSGELLEAFPFVTQ